MVCGLQLIRGQNFSMFGGQKRTKDGLLQHTFPTSRLRVRPHPMVGRSKRELEERGYHVYTHKHGDV